MVNKLEALGQLLGDIYDLEYLTYEVCLSQLKKGILIPLTIKAVQEQQVLKLLAPHCHFFNENNQTFLPPGRTKKTLIYTRFRDRLDSLPICIDDVITVTLLGDDQQSLFSISGLVSAISDATFSLHALPAQITKFWLKIELTAEGQVRHLLEKELHSHDHLTSLLKKFKDDVQKNNHVPNTHTINKRLALLNIEKPSRDLAAKIFYTSKFPDIVNTTHFLLHTKDLMVIQNMMENFYKNLSNQKIMQLNLQRKSYRHRLMELKGRLESGNVLATSTHTD